MIQKNILQMKSDKIMQQKLLNSLKPYIQGTFDSIE